MTRQVASPVPRWHRDGSGETPEELQRKFEEVAGLKTAFEALTPGRQRAYLLYFTGARQAKTREARIEKHIPHILSGKGFHD